MSKGRTGWSTIARRVRVPLGFVFAIVYIWLAEPNVLSLAIGTSLVVLGILVRALASGHVQKNQQLATSGPYAYTRNPLYLGSIIIAAGFGIAGRNWWVAAILVIFFIAIYLPVIRGEEEFLRGKFPEFELYATQVPRLLPRLTARGDKGTFSWDLYRKHREYNALLGSIALIVILIAKLVWPVIRLR